MRLIVLWLSLTTSPVHGNGHEHLYDWLDTDALIQGWEEATGQSILDQPLHSFTNKLRRRAVQNVQSIYGTKHMDLIMKELGFEQGDWGVARAAFQRQTRKLTLRDLVRAVSKTGFSERDAIAMWFSLVNRPEDLGGYVPEAFAFTEFHRTRLLQPGARQENSPKLFRRAVDRTVAALSNEDKKIILFSARYRNYMSDLSQRIGAPVKILEPFSRGILSSHAEWESRFPALESNLAAGKVHGADVVGSATEARAKLKAPEVLRRNLLQLGAVVARVPKNKGIMRFHMFEGVSSGTFYDLFWKTMEMWRIAENGSGYPPHIVIGHVTFLSTEDMDRFSSLSKEFAKKRPPIKFYFDANVESAHRLQGVSYARMRKKIIQLQSRGLRVRLGGDARAILGEAASIPTMLRNLKSPKNAARVDMVELLRHTYSFPGEPPVVSDAEIKRIVRLAMQGGGSCLGRAHRRATGGRRRK